MIQKLNQCELRKSKDKVLVGYTGRFADQKKCLHFLEAETTTDYKVRKKAKIRKRYNQVPHLTQAITWESDRYTKLKKKHHIQESQ